MGEGSDVRSVLKDMFFTSKTERLTVSIRTATESTLSSHLVSLDTP